MAQSLPAETDSALDTLDQVANASNVLRAEISRLARGLGAASKERDSFREQFKTASYLLKSEREGRKKAELELSSMRTRVERREERMRADEEEIGRHREELVEQLKKIGKTLEESAARQARRPATPPLRSRTDGPATSSDSYPRPWKRPRQEAPLSYVFIGKPGGQFSRERYGDGQAPQASDDKAYPVELRTTASDTMPSTSLSTQSPRTSAKQPRMKRKREASPVEASWD
ncbi:hypothetical protein K438DRAFT_1757931 [Mycena galopus ATCC 62051]|nr:hypothetical protein K438DRAFT_1757931 [Mycena galopus ATCC 62051]